MFRIRVEEDDQIDEYCHRTAKGVWHQIVEQIDLLRRKHGLVKMFSVYITGEDLFGLTVRKNIEYRRKNVMNSHFFFRNHISFV